MAMVGCLERGWLGGWCSQGNFYTRSALICQIRKLIHSNPLLVLSTVSWCCGKIQTQKSRMSCLKVLVLVPTRRLPKCVLSRTKSNNSPVQQPTTQKCLQNSAFAWVVGLLDNDVIPVSPILLIAKAGFCLDRRIASVEIPHHSYLALPPPSLTPIIQIGV